MQNRLAQLIRWTHLGEDLLLAAMLIGMIVLAAAQIFLRNLFEWNFAWGDPVVRVLVLWVGMMGAMAASRRNEKGKDRHISIDVLSPILQGKPQHLARIATSLFTAVVCGLLCWHAGRFAYDEYQFGSVGVGGIPLWIFQAVLPFAFGVMTWRFFLTGCVHLLQLFQPEPEQRPDNRDRN